MTTTDNHEMKMCHDGRIRAIYTDGDGCEYAIIDGERDYSYGYINTTPDDLHGRPGEFCPTCGSAHCVSVDGREQAHDWDSDGYCSICGADGSV